MNNKEYAEYPFKYYPLDLSLTQAANHLRNLLRDLDNQLGASNVNYEMRSEAQAELKGITQWSSYDPKVYCKEPKHYSGTIFIKTSFGWMHHCCAKELGLSRLPNTYVEPTKEEIQATFAERKSELEIITEYKRKLATLKGVATRKANTEKLAKEKELKKAARATQRASMTPQEKLERKMARAQIRDEKAL